MQVMNLYKLVLNCKSLKGKSTLICRGRDEMPWLKAFLTIREKTTLECWAEISKLSRTPR